MEFSSFDSKDNFYSFYYDESGNARKFYIKTGKNKFNVDGDPNQKARYNFSLGGVVHKGKATSFDPAELIIDLKLQKSAKELKLDQIAKGDFSELLTSSKLGLVLKWILNGDCYIHYFNLNMVYWAFIDVVDDCFLFCANQITFPFKSDAECNAFINDIKGALYDAVKGDTENFLELLSGFKYPAIEGKERDFVAAIMNFVKSYRRQLITAGFGRFSSEVKSCDGLIHVLELCESINEMGLTDDSEDTLIIDGLAIFYQYRSAHFKNSIHIFDEEAEVQKDLEESKALKELSAKEVSFVDSEITPFIQISDVIAGLFGKYFDYLDRHSISELLKNKKVFNQQQLENMRLIRKLIEKSDDHCKQFLFYVMSSGEHRKHRAFMFPDA